MPLLHSEYNFRPIPYHLDGQFLQEHCHLPHFPNQSLQSHFCVCEKYVISKMKPSMKPSISLVKSKLTRFPGSCIKPAIVNQDVVENHFCQLKGANGQNDNPTYQIVQGTQNSIIFGQTTISKKCNSGTTSKNISFAGLPKEKLFSRR